MNLAKPPKVTVLMPVYNGGEQLRDAIDSVLAQTFPDFELLVVDDRSTDGSDALVRGYDDSRVRLIRNDVNLGQGPTLNRGLAEARGQFIARLDQDDLCAPERLEREVAVIEEYDTVALVGTWATVILDEGRVVGHARGSIRTYVDFVYANLTGEIVLPHSSALFRRDVVLELGGYDPSFHPSEDKDLWQRLALHRYDARIVESELIRYRIHDQQLSRAREELQQELAVKSQDSFLRALAGPALNDVTSVRMLLRADPRLFAAGVATALEGLDAVLAGAAERLRLSRAEQASLEHRVRRRVAYAARVGRHGAALSWWRNSPGLARYGRSRGGRRADAEFFWFLLSFPLAPVFARGAGTAQRAARALLGIGAFEGIRRRARRNRLARRIYSWAIGR